MSTTPHPADSICTAGSLSDAGATMPSVTTTPSRHALADIGPATPAPSWCLPDAMPDWLRRTEKYGGGQICVWERALDDGVYIVCEDEVMRGRVLRSEPRIFGTEEPEQGWTAAEARELAAHLVAAADLIDQALSR